LSLEVKVKIFVDIFFSMGILFSAIGVLGIFRGKDIFKRIQSSMVIYTLGVFPILIALSVYNLSRGYIQTFIKLIIIIVVLFVTMPLLNSLLLKRSYSQEDERKGITLDEYGSDKSDKND